LSGAHRVRSEFAIWRADRLLRISVSVVPIYRKSEFASGVTAYLEITRQGHWPRRAEHVLILDRFSLYPGLLGRLRPPVIG